MTRGRIVIETKRRITECKLKARDARKVADDSRGVGPLQLSNDLQVHADGFESMARMYARRLAELGINRKNRGEAAEQRIAIQQFVKCLQDRLKIECDIASRKQAVTWLVEAALGSTIPESRIAEAFRVPRVGDSI
jgi:hypothetical protein